MTSYSFAPPSAVLDGMVQLVIIPPSWLMAVLHEKSPLVAPRPGGSEIEAAELSQLTKPDLWDRAARRWRESLREKVTPFMLSPDSKNTLTGDQTWHHITLAFKPTRDEFRELVDVYGRVSPERCIRTDGPHRRTGHSGPDPTPSNPYGYCNRALRFIPEEVRADEEICAVFGHVKVDGVLQPELWYITIGGSLLPTPTSDGIFKSDDQAGRLEYDYVTTTAWDCVSWPRRKHKPSEIELLFHVAYFDKAANL